MGARSNHHMDVHKWILKVIASCTTERQLRNSSNLQVFYHKRYKDKVEWIPLNDLRRDQVMAQSKQIKKIMSNE